MTTTHIHRTVDAVWRIESARLIAALARIVRDVGLAQDLAQDALVIALEQWPESGIPNNPGAWLMATARLGRFDEARAEFKRAASLTRNTRERELLLERARAAGQ